MMAPLQSTYIPAANQSSSYRTPPVKDSTRPRPCPWPCPCTLPSWSTTSPGVWNPRRSEVTRRGRLHGPDSPTAKARRVTRANAVRESWLSSPTEMEQGKDGRTERVENANEGEWDGEKNPYKRYGVQNWFSSVFSSPVVRMSLQTGFKPARSVAWSSRVGRQQTWWQVVKQRIDIHFSNFSSRVSQTSRIGLIDHSLKKTRLFQSTIFAVRLQILSCLKALWSWCAKNCLLHILSKCYLQSA